MSIQTGTGPVRIDADDAQITHRGTTVALKVRDFGGGAIYILGCSLESTEWKAAELFGFDDGMTPENQESKYGTAAEFVRQFMLPKIIAWLATIFKPGTGTTAIERIAAELARVKFVPQADGSLVASV